MASVHHTNHTPRDLVVSVMFGCIEQRAASDDRAGHRAQSEAPYFRSAPVPVCEFDSWDEVTTIVNDVRRAYLQWMGLDDSSTDGWQVYDEVVFGNPYYEELADAAVTILYPLTAKAASHVSRIEKNLFCVDLHFTVIRNMKNAIKSAFYPTNDTNASLTVLRFSTEEYRHVLKDCIYRLLPDLKVHQLSKQNVFLPEMLAKSMVADTRPFFAREFPSSRRHLSRLLEAFLLSQHHRVGKKSSAAALTPDCVGQIADQLFGFQSVETLCLHQNIAILCRNNSLDRLDSIAHWTVAFESLFLRVD